MWNLSEFKQWHQLPGKWSSPPKPWLITINLRRRIYPILDIQYSDAQSLVELLSVTRYLLRMANKYSFKRNIVTII